MDLLERIVLFTVGLGVGFILGYIVARLREIERKVDTVGREVHEVDEIVKGKTGALERPPLTHILMLVVLLITAFAAFSAAKTNNALEETVYCLTRFNTNQNEALSSRDEAIKDETQAEIYLWTIYDELYRIGVNAGPRQQAAVQERFREAIIEYRDQLVKTQRARSEYLYDDPDVLKNCRERTR